MNEAANTPRILYIEDDAGLARLVQKRMTRAGYVIDVAPDGESGLERFDVEPYDIVAVDQAMPGLSGLDLLKIFSNKEAPPLMLMITGRGNETLAVEAMRSGASDYVVKDVEGRYFETLPSIVERLMERKRLLDQNRKVDSMRKRLEEQLQQAQKMEAIGRLAGGIAHDINNMLSGIMGFASLLHLEMEWDDPKVEDVREILTICKRARDLTANLLGFARKGKYQKEPIDLSSSILQLRGILERTVSKGITIDTQIASGLPLIEGDASQMSQVLMNLCINAADAMGKVGDLTIVASDVAMDETLAGQHGVEPGRYVEVVVTDTGEGIPREIHDKVFEPFFTTKVPGEGTGLGLSMVYGTVKNHGGMVSFESEPGQGTSMTVLLPALDVSTDDVGPISSDPALHGPQGHGTILLVDDEEMVRASTKRLLETMGFSVILAVNGQEAVDVFRGRSSEISLVLLDMVMPVLGGAEAFEQLRKIDPQIPVLIISGFSADSIANGLLRDDAVGFVRKPFVPAELAKALAQCLEDSERS